MVSTVRKVYINIGYGVNRVKGGLPRLPGIPEYTISTCQGADCKGCENYYHGRGRVTGGRGSMRTRLLTIPCPARHQKSTRNIGRTTGQYRNPPRRHRIPRIGQIIPYIRKSAG